MTPLRRLVSLGLLLAVTLSSIEVLLGDRHAVADGAAAEISAPSDAPVETSVALTSTTSDSGASGDDCPCLCACICAGSQLVTFSLGDGFHPVIPALEIPVVESVRPHPLAAHRPPFRPPLG